MAAEYVESGADDGVILGRSDGKVGFFGTTPVVQQNVTGSLTTVISQVATSGKWAFATSTAAKRLVEQVQDLEALVKAFGLGKGG
jgi:hypothetical protein